MRGNRCKFRKRLKNTFDNTVRVHQYVVVPEAQNEIANRFQLVCACCVLLRGACVLTAIQLHNEACRLAAEVHHITAKRHLTSEFQSGKTAITQAKPQRTLCVGLIAPQSPGMLY